MIAMALALEPALLIADEPTTALDVTTQAQILKLIVELQRKHGMGVLFITHDFGVVAEIAHRVAVLREGRAGRARRASDEVLQRPRHEYTRMLIRVGADAGAARARRATPAAPVVLETREPVEDLRRPAAGSAARREVRAAQRRRRSRCARGQTLGIVGESGSGKSTVARCIVRLVEPSARRDPARRRGHRRACAPRALRPLRRRVQIVFQDPYRSLNPRRTRRRGDHRGPAQLRRAARARRSSARAGCSSWCAWTRRRSTATRTSSPAASASASASRARSRWSPSCWSPTRRCRRSTSRCRRRCSRCSRRSARGSSLAMLFITHDLRVAAQVCDQVAVMQQGRVVEYGPAREVFARAAARVHARAVRRRAGARLRVRRLN